METALSNCLNKNNQASFDDARKRSTLFFDNNNVSNPRTCNYEVGIERISEPIKRKGSNLKSEKLKIFKRDDYDSDEDEIIFISKANDLITDDEKYQMESILE